MEARGGVLPGAMRWRRRGRPGEPRSGRPRRADGLLMAYLPGEASPTLPPVPGVDPGGYRDSLLQRCGNPAVRDTLGRLCEDTSDRIPSLVLPVARERLVRGAEITRSALVVASQARYAEGDRRGRSPHRHRRPAGRTSCTRRPGASGRTQPPSSPSAASSATWRTTGCSCRRTCSSCACCRSGGPGARSRCSGQSGHDRASA